MADAATLLDMDEDAQFKLVAQMTHDAGVAANKIRAAQGKPLIEITPVDEVVAYLKEKYGHEVR